MLDIAVVVFHCFGMHAPVIWDRRARCMRTSLRAPEDKRACDEMRASKGSLTRVEGMRIGARIWTRLGVSRMHLGCIFLGASISFQPKDLCKRFRLRYDFIFFKNS